MKKSAICSAITLAIALGNFDRILAAKCIQNTSTHILLGQGQSLQARPMSCTAETSGEEPIQA